MHTVDHNENAHSKHNYDIATFLHLSAPSSKILQWLCDRIMMGLSRLPAPIVHLDWCWWHKLHWQWLLRELVLLQQPAKLNMISIRTTSQSACNQLCELILFHSSQASRLVSFPKHSSNIARITATRQTCSWIGRVAWEQTDHTTAEVSCSRIWP